VSAANSTVPRGVVYVCAMDLSAILILVGAAAFTAILISSFVVASRRRAREARLDRELLATGVAAAATVVSAAVSGEGSGTVCVRLELEVAPPGARPYRVNPEVWVSLLQAPLFQPGASTVVRFAPARPWRVAIESVGGIPLPQPRS
jgi:hypothetical protein